MPNAHETAVQMIDTSIVRVPQHGACIARNKRQSIGRRGGLTSKVHAFVIPRLISPILDLNPLERARTELKLAPGFLVRSASSSLTRGGTGGQAPTRSTTRRASGASPNQSICLSRCNAVVCGLEPVRCDTSL